MTKDFLVFDLETQRDKNEVGGWGNIREMRMSVGVVWDHSRGESLVFYEDRVEDLIELLCGGKPVIGFNHVKFDYVVLSGYRKGEAERKALLDRLSHSNNLDMLLDLASLLGHRIKLESAAKATLAAGKTADGLAALKWWKEYRSSGDESLLKRIVDYCVRDVQVTKDLFLFGVENGKIYYESQGGVKSVRVAWKEAEFSGRGAPASDNIQGTLF